MMLTLLSLCSQRVCCYGLTISAAPSLRSKQEALTWEVVGSNKTILYDIFHVTDAIIKADIQHRPFCHRIMKGYAKYRPFRTNPSSTARQDLSSIELLVKIAWISEVSFLNDAYSGWSASQRDMHLHFQLPFC